MWCCLWLMGVCVGGGMVVVCGRMGLCGVTVSCEGIWVGEEGGVSWGSLVGSVCWGVGELDGVGSWWGGWSETCWVWWKGRRDVEGR